MVERLLCMQKVRGSIPLTSKLLHIISFPCLFLFLNYLSLRANKYIQSGKNVQIELCSMARFHDIRSMLSQQLNSDFDSGEYQLLSTTSPPREATSKDLVRFQLMESRQDRAFLTIV